MTAHVHPHLGSLNGATDSSSSSGTETQSVVQQLTSALMDLKTELALGDWAEDHPIKSKILQLSELVGSIGQDTRGEREIFQRLSLQLYQATDVESLLTTAVTRLRESLGLDRVLVLRFEEPGRGRVDAEAVAAEYTPVFQEVLPVIMFGADKAEVFAEQQVVSFSDRVGLTPRQMQLLTRFQIEASVSVPIRVEGRIWGILAAHHCLTPRQWLESELILLQQVAQALALHLQTLFYQDLNQRQTERNQAVTRLVDRIRLASSQEEVYRACTQGLRQLLSADRVGIYRFNPDWSGGFIAESAGDEWVKLLDEQQTHTSLLRNVSDCSAKELARGSGLVGQTDADTYLQKTQGGRYRQGELFRVTPDVYAEGFSDCYLDLLESYQARAYVIAAVYKGQQLWGLLAVYQNSGPRQWQSDEIALVVQISTQLGAMIQQLDSVAQLAAKTEELIRTGERDRFLSELGTKLRRHLGDEAALFRTVTQELRSLTGCDRVGIYQFNSDWSGQFVAEAVASGWTSILEEQTRNTALLQNISTCTVKDLAGSEGLYAQVDTHLQQSQGGQFTRGELYRVCNDIHAAGFTPCYIQALESYQARAYIVVAIFLDQKLWGLLAMYQNSGARQWTESEINLGVLVANQMAQVLEQTRYVKQLQDQSRQLAEAAKREQGLVKVIREIRQTLNIDTIFATATREVRTLLNLDRTAIYRFNPEDWSGEFIAESVGGTWGKLLGRQVKDTYLERTKGGRYVQNETHVINDIHQAGFDECHLDLLESFQCQAYVIAPIFAGQELWGLFAAYQNSGPRQWEEADVSLIVQIGEQLGVALAQADFVAQVQTQSQREQGLVKVIREIRQTLDIDTIFSTATREVRMLLGLDRAAVYRFNPDWSGEFIAESVAGGWNKLLNRQVRDTYLEENKGGRYIQNETHVINDIHRAGFDECHVDLLESFQCRAYIIAPIFAGQELWGLFAAYQNSGPREWEEADVNLVVQIGEQLGVALAQADFVSQVQTQSQREKGLVKVIREIRQTLDIDTLFANAAREVRLLLGLDRAALYQFMPDWSGEFVAESVASGWNKLLGRQVKDTYLEENQGGRYVKNETHVIDDVYAAGFDQCHVELLESFQARAYVIVPVFAGQKIWGLFAAYQNSGPREWEESEVNLLVQVAEQFGIALNQAQYLDQLQTQSQQLAEAAERERQAKERLQQEALALLRAIEPSFRGDLTVRAPLTEDEVGTIADAYNTTVQSLRELVRQVQMAAARVSQTSSGSTTSVSELATQAQYQTNQIVKALDQLKSIGQSVQAVAGAAQRVDQAVQQANQTVQTGDVAMNRTVDGILEIRETVSETAKKIKRLGESTQKISKVVSLIENFATQTNLLALNAAIEATRAGEYGRGFAVVADEVRSLAYQSANATTEIERLVQEIQAETNEVAEAMELGIAQVVQGTDLVNETRRSLTAIVASTEQISQLVQGISQATIEQTQQSEQLTEAMNDVASIASRTSEDSARISGSFQELLATSQELQASVSQFKVD